MDLQFLPKLFPDFGNLIWEFGNRFEEFDGPDTGEDCLIASEYVGGLSSILDLNC